MNSRLLHILKLGVTITGGVACVSTAMAITDRGYWRVITFLLVALAFRFVIWAALHRHGVFPVSNRFARPATSVMLVVCCVLASIISALQLRTEYAVMIQLASFLGALIGYKIAEVACVVEE